MFENIKRKVICIALLLSIVISSIHLTSSAENSDTTDETMVPLETAWTMTPTGRDPIKANPNNNSNAINMWTTTTDGKKVLRENTENIPSSILHTPALIMYNHYNTYYLDYQNLLSWIEPTQEVEWKKATNGYMEYFDWKFSGNPNSDEEWKMFRGEFNLSESQLASLESGSAKLLIAVPGKTGPQMIYPLNDYASFFANEHDLDINFMTHQPSSNQKLSIINKGENKYLDFKVAYRPGGTNPCNNSEHSQIMNESWIGNKSDIDNWHVHLDNVDESNTRNSIGEIKAAYLNVGSNKLEILAGDNWTGGGVVKPEIYFYEDVPSINVKKKAYIKVGEGENIKKIYLYNEDAVAPGQRVYFEFEMTNKSNTRAVTDLSFEDNALGINATINKDSTYSKIEVYNTKDLNSNLGYNGLSKLEKGESIILRCEDVLYYDTKESDRNTTITNTVTGHAKYFNNQLEANANASVTITVEDKAYAASIDKSIYKVNGLEIMDDNQTQVNEKKNFNNLHPKDEVIFEIDITNRSKGKLNDSASELIDLPMVGLSLTDLLQSSNYSKSDWIFKDINGKELDLSNFGLKEKETKKIYAKWTVPSDDSILLDMNNGITNTATLSHYGEEIGSSSVNLGLGTWSIKLSKNIYDIDNLDESEKDRKFTINLKGSDGKVYTVAAKHEEVYTIDNLKYGITYNVDEIVPMNYTLKSIMVESESVKDKNLNHDYKDKTIVVTNQRTNNNWFFDEKRDENKFKITPNL